MSFPFFGRKSETPVGDKGLEHFLSLDLSPLDYIATSHAVAHKVNRLMGARDGDYRIARGQILYPRGQDARRQRVLSVPLDFYQE